MRITDVARDFLERTIERVQTMGYRVGACLASQPFNDLMCKMSIFQSGHLPLPDSGAGTRYV